MVLSERSVEEQGKQSETRTAVVTDVRRIQAPQKSLRNVEALAFS